MLPRFALTLFLLTASAGWLRAQTAPSPPRVEPETPPPTGLSFAMTADSGNTDAEATLVVFNESDPESGLLAQFYAEKRGIPKTQVVGLACPNKEEISRAEYDETIAEPLRRAFTTNFWWKLREADHAAGPVESNRIRFVALMRGMPLKIAPATGYPGDKPYTTTPVGQHNEAAVDSELAMLGYRLTQISGAANNPYYRSMQSFRDARRPEVMLVCRLDAPTAPMVRRMIVDTLEVEKTGLRGIAYIDARGIGTSEPGLLEGDQWLLAAGQDLRRLGMPVILDNGPAMFPDGYPMRYAALYLGWYGEKVSGPIARPGFRFLPGALAVHIHSFSGSSIRDPKGNWVGPLLEAGAAATLGNVYEPYLSLTPHLDLFEERLRLGFNFAESAYASQRVLSWMTTFVGDPLYRPFPTLGAQMDSKGMEEWEAYRKGAMKWLEDRKAGGAELQASAKRLSSGIVWEGLALLQVGANDRPGAVDSLEQARKAYTNAEDQMRVTIHELIQLRAAGRETEAATLAKKQAAANPTSPSVPVLQMLAPAAFPKRQP